MKSQLQVESNRKVGCISDKSFQVVLVPL